MMGMGMGRKLAGFCRAFSGVGLLTSALVFMPTSAEAAWRTFGYPAQHRDLVSTKDAQDTAAFNFTCEPGHNMGSLELRGTTLSRNTVLTLSVDGKPAAKHSAYVTSFGSVAMMEFDGSNAEGARWLTAIANATSDVTITTGYGGAAHFNADGARNAATTAMDYCKLK
jgi:hypothetical protein